MESYSFDALREAALDAGGEALVVGFSPVAGDGLPFNTTIPALHGPLAAPSSARFAPDLISASLTLWASALRSIDPSTSLVALLQHTGCASSHVGH
jgi:hypothetical protein